MANINHNPLLLPTKERGAIMLITLIALSLLMLSTMALIRSFDTSMTMAGNLAFKRDLINQGERGITSAIALFKTGALNTASARNNNLLANNYSATTLPSDPHGIPLALLNNSTFTSLGMSGSDISDNSSHIRVRYVVDRLCNSTGAFSSGACRTICLDKGGSATQKNQKCDDRAVYRISVRATGPRNTQAYMQTTFTTTQ